MPDINQYLNACEVRQQFLQEQLEWLSAEKQNYQQSTQELNHRLARIRQEAVGYLLPDLKNSQLEELQSRLRYPGLLPIKESYDLKFREAHARRESLEAMDEIKFHDLQLHQAEEAVQELAPAYQNAVKRRKLWTDSRPFRRLHQRGYFELDRQFGWWSRFLNWRDVSFLMGILSRGGEPYDDPEELRNAYRLLHEQSDDCIRAYDQRVAARDRILNLHQEWIDLKAAPQRLLSELYADLGNAILEHLQSCPDSLRIELAKQDPTLDAFLRKDVGLSKQIQYLKELAVTRIDQPQQQIVQEKNRLESKVFKLRAKKTRGKFKRFSESEVTQMRSVDHAKWEKRRHQTTTARERLSQFDRYDHGSFITQFLWWDLITGGLRGDDLFEVRQFHEQNPNWDYREQVDPVHGQSLHQPIDDAAESLAAEVQSPADDQFQDGS